MTDYGMREKRNHVRVPFHGTVFYRVVGRAEDPGACQAFDIIQSPSMTAMISEHFDESGKSRHSLMDRHLVEFLLHLEDKLDRILGLVGGGPEKGLEQARGIDLSSSGLKFYNHPSLEVGQLLELHFAVSRYPLIKINVCGEVVRISPLGENPDSASEVAVEFTDIGEQASENIMAYAFRVQREVLRSKRLEMERQNEGAEDEDGKDLSSDAHLKVDPPEGGASGLGA